MSSRYEYNLSEDWTQLIVATQASRERDPGTAGQRIPAAIDMLSFEHGEVPGHVR